MSAIVSPALSCASRVEAPRCGVTTTCSSCEQRRLGRRLGGEHVERGAGDDTVAQALGQVALVDDAAAGDVDHAQRRLRLEQQVAVDQPGGLLGLRQVDREEVGLGDDLVERQQLDAHLLAPGRPTRTGRRRRRACRTPWPGRRRACRCGRGRRRRASCRRARRPPSGCAPSGRRRARRGPAARCGPGRAAAPSCARRPR